MSAPAPPRSGTAPSPWRPRGPARGDPRTPPRRLPRARCFQAPDGAAKIVVVRPALAPRAAAIAAECPVFDAHVDALQRQLDLGHDLGAETPGQFDLARARRGGVGAVVLVSWCEPLFIDRPGGAFERTAKLLREAHVLARRHPARAALAGNGAELARARASGRIAIVPGIEGGHSIEESLEKLDWFFERGVRVLTLVWNNHLTWIRSCQDGAGPEVPAGLSKLGREVVQRLNALGVLVDLSHAGERSFYDALEASAAAPIASHSGCKALHDHPRNLSDEQLRALARRGGVCGIVFHPGFLDAGARAEEARVRASEGYQRLAGAPGASETTSEFARQSEYLRAHAAPLPAGRLVDHVVHAAEVAGVEHVGVGSDFDGIQRSPEGLEDAACYGRLAELLLGRGFAEDEVRAVLGGNMEHAFAAATGPGTRAAAASITPLD